MSRLAKHILRKRVIFEGYHDRDVDESFLRDFLNRLNQHLGMHLVWGPEVFDLAGGYNPAHKGFEAIVIWAESGAQLYTWKNEKFFTLDVYTCREFENDSLVQFVVEEFNVSDRNYEFREV